jgi:NAD(P)H-hydrate epimerase
VPDNLAVVTALEARERDRLAIEAGTPSRTLMQNAGVAAANSIRRLYPDALRSGVEIHTGPGNNGGDGWVVAGELAKSGISVQVVECEEPRTPDAMDAKALALHTNMQSSSDDPGIIVDALLGTGSKGVPTGKIADSVRAIMQKRTESTKVISLDIPTGLDATTGESIAGVVADTTLTFGTIKRGQLIARGLCGAIEVLDIGLQQFGLPGVGDVALASDDWVAAHIPAIKADAHKGTRKRLAVIGGGSGMAGAAILAGKGALRSGIGLLHLIVDERNRAAVHAAVPSAIVSSHTELLEDAASLLGAADAIVIGPGLDPATARRLLDATAHQTLPILLDAGAISAFDDKVADLARFATDRMVVLTPHPAEMGRLVGVATADVLTKRFEIGAELAKTTATTVLLKGTPTVVSDSSRRMVSATGTPALATGGSGDMLSGVIGTLLAQTRNGFESAVCGAWVHGRAAELCGPSRGITLDDILFAMPAAWKTRPSHLRAGMLASLPAIQ